MPCLFIFKLTTKILGEKPRSPQSECLHLARYFATNLWEPLLLMVHAPREEILVFNATGSWMSSVELDRLHGQRARCRGFLMEPNLCPMSFSPRPKKKILFFLSSRWSSNSPKTLCLSKLILAKIFFLLQSSH